MRRFDRLRTRNNRTTNVNSVHSPEFPQNSRSLSNIFVSTQTPENYEMMENTFYEESKCKQTPRLKVASFNNMASIGVPVGSVPS